MESILGTLLDLAGVNAVLLFDGSGALLAHRGRSIYDLELCAQASAGLIKVVDSIALQQPDWEAVAARFDEGAVLMRNLGSQRNRSYVLAVVADATLHTPFATVAMRVATTRLRKALAEAAAPQAHAPAQAPVAARAPPAAPAPPSKPPRPSAASLLKAIASAELGAQATQVLEMLSAAGPSRADLFRAVGEIEQLVRLFINKKKASELARKMRELVAAEVP